VRKGGRKNRSYMGGAEAMEKRIDGKIGEEAGEV
jgi:hypothetical protein